MKFLYRTMEKRYFALIFIAICSLLLGYISLKYHYYFEEYDGIAQCFESMLLLSGKGYSGWGSYYWGPFYTILLTVVYLLTNDYFIAGKIISIFCIAGMGYYLWKLNVLLFEDIALRHKLFTLFLFFTTPFIILKSFMVENELLASFLAFAAIYYLILLNEKQSIKHGYLFAIFGAFAIITRSTNLFLILCPILIMIYQYKKEQLVFLNKNNLVYIYSIMLIPFVLFIIYSISIKGSYENYNYLNVASSVFGDTSFWTYGIFEYDSFIDIFKKSPFIFLFHYSYNIIAGLAKLLISPSFVIPTIMSLYGFALYIKKTKNRHAYLIIIVTTFLLFRSIAGLKDDFYLLFLPLLLVYSCISSEHIYKLKEKVHHKYKYIPTIILALIIISNLSIAGQYSQNYLFDHSEIHDLDIIEAGTFLKTYSNNTNETIISIHPGYSYYGGKNYVLFPYQKDLSSDQSIPWNIFYLHDYPTKFQKARPFYMIEKDDDGYVDYIVIDNKLIESKRLNDLFVKNRFEKKWMYGNYTFTQIYVSDNCVIFEIQVGDQ